MFCLFVCASARDRTTSPNKNVLLFIYFFINYIVQLKIFLRQNCHEMQQATRTPLNNARSLIYLIYQHHSSWIHKFIINSLIDTLDIVMDYHISPCAPCQRYQTSEGLQVQLPSHSSWSSPPCACPLGWPYPCTEDKQFKRTKVRRCHNT